MLYFFPVFISLCSKKGIGFFPTDFALAYAGTGSEREKTTQNRITEFVKFSTQLHQFPCIRQFFRWISGTSVIPDLLNGNSSCRKLHIAMHKIAFVDIVPVFFLSFSMRPWNTSLYAKSDSKRHRERYHRGILQFANDIQAELLRSNHNFTFYIFEREKTVLVRSKRARDAQVSCRVESCDNNSNNNENELVDNVKNVSSQ